MSTGAHLPLGRLLVDARAYLAPGAIVCGDVRIGPDSSVWFNAVIRGDSARIEIGERSNVQDLSMVHVDEDVPTIIGNDVTIGHRAIVHGCIIENEVLIGMGAIVLSGAWIGTGSLIGAGALVRERQVIPAGSLVLGTPARIVGEVKDAHRQAIAHGAAYYADLAKDYRAKGIGQRIPTPDEWALGGGGKG